MGRRGSGSTRYSGVGGQGSRKYRALEGDGHPHWPIQFQYFCLENPSLTEAWQATVCRVAELDATKATLHTKTQGFFACGSSAPVRVEREGGATA